LLERPISLRLKIRSNLVDKLDTLRKRRCSSMNDAINYALAIALEAQENPNDPKSK
jgi:hypothetical protein